MTPSLRRVAEPVRPVDVVVLDSLNPGLGLGVCRAGAQADSRRRSGGHKQLRRFASQYMSWLAERRARIETVASTRAGRRAVVELLAHMAGDGQGAAELRSFCTRRFSEGGGIGLQHPT